MVQQGHTTQRALEAQHTRRVILDAADSLFGRVGFAAATTREIAEASGANKALIHYHFGGKDGLLESVLDRYYEKLSATVAGALTPGGELREALHRLLDVYVDFLGANPNFFRIVQREAAGGPHAAGIAARMRPILELGIPAIRAALPRTAGGPLSAEHLATSFYGMIITYFSYAEVIGRLWGGNPLAGGPLGERKAHLHWMLDATWDALAASAPAAPAPRRGRR